MVELSEMVLIDAVGDYEPLLAVLMNLRDWTQR
jgi:hypothetical protein